MSLLDLIVSNTLYAECYSSYPDRQKAEGCITETGTSPSVGNIKFMAFPNVESSVVIHRIWNLQDSGESGLQY